MKCVTLLLVLVLAVTMVTAAPQGGILGGLLGGLLSGLQGLLTHLVSFLNCTGTFLKNIRSCQTNQVVNHIQAGITIAPAGCLTRNVHDLDGTLVGHIHATIKVTETWTTSCNNLNTHLSTTHVGLSGVLVQTTTIVANLNVNITSLGTQYVAAAKVTTNVVLDNITSACNGLFVQVQAQFALISKNIGCPIDDITTSFASVNVKLNAVITLTGRMNLAASVELQLQLATSIQAVLTELSVLVKAVIAVAAIVDVTLVLVVEALAALPIILSFVLQAVSAVFCQIPTIILDLNAELTQILNIIVGLLSDSVTGCGSLANNLTTNFTNISVDIQVTLKETVQLISTNCGTFVTGFDTTITTVTTITAQINVNVTVDTDVTIDVVQTDCYGNIDTVFSTINELLVDISLKVNINVQTNISVLVVNLQKNMKSVLSILFDLNDQKLGNVQKQLDILTDSCNSVTTNVKTLVSACQAASIQIDVEYQEAIQVFVNVMFDISTQLAECSNNVMTTINKSTTTKQQIQQAVVNQCHAFSQRVKRCVH